MRKALGAELCLSFIEVRMSFNSEESAATAASIPVLLAAATLAVTSCIFSLSSSVHFKSNWQQLHPVLVTADKEADWLLNAETAFCLNLMDENGREESICTL